MHLSNEYIICICSLNGWIISMTPLPNRTKDIAGMQFGSLLATEYSHIRDRQAYWKYTCKCGKDHIARSNTISYIAKIKNDPELPSCGCVELARKTKHGFRKAKDTHPAYKSYRSMLDRCYNKNSPVYKWYGAVGVTVCDAWLNNPEAFVVWSLGNGWAKGLHVDKDILCDKQGIHPHVYSPDTCQWVTAKENVGYVTNRDNFGKHPNVRLSHEEVADILNSYFSGEVTNQSELARMHGLLSSSSVNRLIQIANIRAV